MDITYDTSSVIYKPTISIYTFMQKNDAEIIRVFLGNFNFDNVEISKLSIKELQVINDTLIVTMEIGKEYDMGNVMFFQLSNVAVHEDRVVFYFAFNREFWEQEKRDRGTS